MKNEQRPPRQTFEQQELSPEHVSPSVAQVALWFWQTLPVHTFPQHWMFDVQAPPPATHVLAAEQVRDCGSQKSEQHSLDSAHVAPEVLHWLGPLQRFTPSTSWSHACEQQSEPVVQVSPVRLQELAGTSHRPLTQLSEQQSVLRVHDWWNDRHVAQLTPGKQVAPEQQPFAHDVAEHWQEPLMHTDPGEHAAPLPHEQAPFVQPSASVALHDVHALPESPQLASDGASHVLPLQHPEVQVWAQPAHVLLVHAVPAAHGAHALPPNPHALLELPGWQVLFWQQPPGQLAPLHTHCPDTHASPAPQAAPAPHRHAPFAQESAVAGSQSPHAPPPVPHVPSD